MKGASFALLKPDRRLIKEGIIRRAKAEYVQNNSGVPATNNDSVEQLLYLFNDMIMWTTPQFNIVQSHDLVKVMCLPDAPSITPHTFCLALRGAPYNPDMMFICKDADEKETWVRYITAAINSAQEFSTHRVGHTGAVVVKHRESIVVGTHGLPLIPSNELVSPPPLSASPLPKSMSPPPQAQSSAPPAFNEPPLLSSTKLNGLASPPAVQASPPPVPPFNVDDDSSHTPPPPPPFDPSRLGVAAQPSQPQQSFPPTQPTMMAPAPIDPQKRARIHELGL